MFSGSGRFFAIANVRLLLMLTVVACALFSAAPNAVADSSAPDLEFTQPNAFMASTGARTAGDSAFLSAAKSDKPWTSYNFDHEHFPTCAKIKGGGTALAMYNVKGTYINAHMKPMGAGSCGSNEFRVQTDKKVHTTIGSDHETLVYVWNDEKKADDANKKYAQSGLVRLDKLVMQGATHWGECASTCNGQSAPIMQVNGGEDAYVDILPVKIDKKYGHPDATSSKVAGNYSRYGTIGAITGTPRAPITHNWMWRKGGGIVRAQVGEDTHFYLANVQAMKIRAYRRCNQCSTAGRHNGWVVARYGFVWSKPGQKVWGWMVMLHTGSTKQQPARSAWTAHYKASNYPPLKNKLSASASASTVEGQAFDGDIPETLTDRLNGPADDPAEGELSEYDIEDDTADNPPPGWEIGPTEDAWTVGHGVGSSGQLLGDVNGDHYDDSIVYFRDGGLAGNWYVAIANPAGGFYNYNATPMISGFAAGSDQQWLEDVDEDGDDDAIAYTKSSGLWHVARANGSGQFIWPDTWRNGHGCTNCRPNVGDVNNDGRADAVIYDPYDSHWSVAYSTGGMFSTPELFNWSFGVGSSNQMLGDVNADGKADAVAYYGTGDWYVALSNGVDFIKTGDGHWGYGHGVNSTRQFVKDVDGDRRADTIVYFNNTGLAGNWYVSLSTGASFLNYNPTPWAIMGDKAANSSNQLLADPSGDNTTDAISYFGGNGVWHVAPGTDTMPPETAVTVGPGGGPSTSYTSDNTPNFTFHSPGDPTVAFYCAIDDLPEFLCTSPYTMPQLTDGTHSFRLAAQDKAGNRDLTPESRDFIVDTTPPETTSSEAQAPATVTGLGEFQATGDVNGDGRDDIVAIRSGDKLAVSISAPNGFSAASTWLDHFDGSPTKIWLTDATGDGKADAVLTHGTGKWFVAPSTGSSFEPATAWASALGEGPVMKMLADVDVDGDSDAIAFDSTTGQWSIAKSNGSSFGSPTVVATAGASSGAQFVEDVTGDVAHLPDLVYVSNGDWYVATNNGSSFAAPVLWRSGFGQGSIDAALADVTGDGRADAVSYDFTTANWRVAAASGSQFAAVDTLWAEGFGANGPTKGLGDLNGDNRADAISYFEQSGGTIQVATSTTTSFDTVTPTKATADRSFNLRSTDQIPMFQCSVDWNGYWSYCGALVTASYLSTGTHTLQARAIDLAGNVDPTPTSKTFVVDATPPTLSVSGLTAQAVSAGPASSCVVTTSQGAKCSGFNTYGQLGNGSTTNSSSPVNVSGLRSGVASVSAGGDFSCALTTTGAVKCWGANNIGQLGNGSTTSSTTPTSVTGLSSGVASIASGYDHACALTTAGAVKCWGFNLYGQLGNGTQADATSPVTVFSSGVSSISAGLFHTCAAMTAGTVKCWGYNATGQLGIAAGNSSSVPVDVAGLTGIAQVAAGFKHTCSLSSSGAVKCWGANDEGQLGNGTAINSSTPVAVTGLATGASSVAVGYGSSCARMSAGTVKCWGGNTYGQTGGAPSTMVLAPTDVAGLDASTASISVGNFHACAISTAGRVQCWGANTYGQLGIGSLTATNVPRAMQTRTINSHSVDLTFTPGGDAVRTSCVLDSVTTSNCTSPKSYTDVPDGNHSVSVVSEDSSGNTNAVAWSFVVDTTAPTVAITAPATNAVVNTATPTLTFSAADASNLALETTCKVDAGSAFPCSSPVVLPTLTSADHTVTVTSLDDAGNSSTSSVTFGVDTQAPTVSLSAPTGTTTSSRPNISFSAADNRGTIASTQCRAAAGSNPGGTFIPCTSSAAWAGTPLANGTNTLQVQVTDPAGNVATAQSTFTVTSSVPSAGITSPAPGALVSTNNVAVNFVARPSTAGIAAVTCKLDSGTAVGCSSGHQFVNVAQGSHSITVTAYDPPGNSSSDTVVFTVDSVAPVATITNPLASTYLNTSGFSGQFSVNEPSTFNCRIDSSANIPCTSPIGVSGLADGLHSFTVEPHDLAGGWSTTSVLFNVDATAPVITLTSPADGDALITASPKKLFTASDAGSQIASLQCRNAAGGQPGGTYATCSTSTLISQTALTDGTYTLQVKATDMAGNVSVAQSTYTVTTGAPTIQIGTDKFNSIASGYEHSCVVLLSEHVKCWGRNDTAQLGDLSNTDRHAPNVTWLLPEVSRLALGHHTSCALVETGGVMCWGGNAHGELGRTANSQSTVPTGVTGLAFSGAIDVSVGENHACAVTVAGIVKCWGDNSQGQLGNGTTAASTTPIDVSGLGGIAVAVSAGDFHTCALLSTGSVKCWGYNRFGQLGTGTATQSLVPIQTSGLTSGATSVAAGGEHTCAIVSGQPKCWGRNNFGQSGDATVVDAMAPVNVSGLSAATKLTAGEYHTCALTVAGAVQCWGLNSRGQLGVTGVAFSTTPVTPLGIGPTVTSISAGGEHTCSVSSDKSARCWGSNSRGQLGDNKTVDETPGALITSMGNLFNKRDFDIPFSTGDVTTNISCRLDSGTIDPYCYTPKHIVGIADGAHTFTVTAYGPSGASNTETWNFSVDATAPTVTISAPTNGSSTTNSSPTVSFVTADTGGSGLVSTKCSIALGILPTDTMTPCSSGSQVPTAPLADGTYTFMVEAIDGAENRTTAQTTFTVDTTGPALTGTTGFTQLAPGNSQTCGLTAASGVKCWGRNHVGQLGNGTTADSGVPVQVPALQSGVVAVDGGDYSDQCALLATGAVQCWGETPGNGSTANSSTPVAVSNMQSGVTQISVGGFHSCGLKAGFVMCWGRNSDGQLGVGHNFEVLTAQPAVNLFNTFKQISAGAYHTCALTTTGGVKCWGYNLVGQLGNGTTTNSNIPVDVIGLTEGVKQISAGFAHNCALLDTGQVKCWGRGIVGELGNGANAHSSTPVDVTGLSSGVASVTASGNSCALMISGQVKCWGDPYGALGAGVLGSNTPVDITALGSDVAQLSIGGFHTCVITTSGAAKCVGSDSNGQIGAGTATSAATPLVVRSDVNSTTATLKFTTGADAVSKSCKLDSGTPDTACVSPKTYTGLAGGSHSVTLTATDALGNTTTTVVPFSVDIVDTTIASGPAQGSITSAPNFTLTSNAAGATYQCRVDGGAFQACSASYTPTLTDGAHTVDVRAIDADGYVDATPATRGFTVESVAPVVSISAPAAATIATATPTVTFSATDANGIAGTTCKVDSGTAYSCASGATLAALSDGSHTLVVSATDNAGNTGTASRTFTVDMVAPETSITSGPTDASTITATTATYGFTSPDGTASFQCKVDSGAYAACTSTFTTPTLAVGAHTFYVRAVDPVGNIDATPAQRTVTVSSPTGSYQPLGSDAITWDIWMPEWGGVDWAHWGRDTASAFNHKNPAPSIPISNYSLLGTGGTVTRTTAPGGAAWSWDNGTPTAVEYVNTGGIQIGGASGRGFRVTIPVVGSQTRDLYVNLGALNTNLKLVVSSSDATFTPITDTSLTNTSTTTPTVIYYGIRVKSNSANATVTFDITQNNATATGAVLLFGATVMNTAGGDTTAPVVSISSPVSGAINTNTPAASFTATDANGIASTTCKVDSGTAYACTSGSALAPLDDGSHTLTVTATDPAGNSGTASRTFTVDTVAPDTSITSGPADASTITATTATYGFTSPDSTAAFQCKVDSGSYSTCTSAYTTSTLAVGAHTFYVRAVDPAGNIDATPTQRTVTVAASSGTFQALGSEGITWGIWMPEWGGIDWAHWGRDTASAFNHKNPAPSIPISNYSLLGTGGTVTRITAPGGASWSWDNGTPTAIENGTTGGIQIGGASGRGFRFTVPVVSAQTRDIYVNLGALNTNLKLVVSSSDATFSTITDTSVTNTSTTTPTVFYYGIRVKSNSANATVTFDITQNNANSTGAVELFGATVMNAAG